MWLGIFLGGYVLVNHVEVLALTSNLSPVFSIFTCILMMYRIKGAILIGIFLTSIVSWPRPTAVTYFPHTDVGDALFQYFKKVVSFHKLTKTGGALSVSSCWPWL